MYNRGGINIMKTYSSFHSFFEKNITCEKFFDFVDELPFNTYFERPAIIKELNKLNFSKVLDAGCAAGWYSKWFVEHGATVTCLDFDNNLLRKCEQRLGKKAQYICADLNKKLPLKDAEYDLVLSSLTLDYIENWDIPINEFYRVLSPGGSLVFSIQHPLDYDMQHSQEDYFTKRMIIHNTRDLGIDYCVKYYHRTLSEILNTVISGGFIINNIVEPVPTETFRKNDPDMYELMLKYPEYLIVRGEKSR